MKMNNVFHVMAILLVSLMVEAQTDVIYPINGDSITNCKINTVLKGNLVNYSKKANNYQKPAKAISIHGKLIFLNENSSIDSTLLNLLKHNTTEKHDFGYYQQTYNESKRISHNGMILTFAGAVACGAGIYQEESGNSGFIGAALFFGGGLMTNAGIPIWISSGIKAANNRKAMERCKMDVTLNFAGTPNGIGFRLALN